MLYDPKWEVKTKPKSPSVEGLIEWLEQQPADGWYDYENCEGRCLVGIYAKAMGLHWYDNAVPCAPWFSELNDIACSSDKKWTFGAALRRARKALATGSPFGG